MKRNAFTLIEALVSLSIIIILSSLLVANYKVGEDYSSLNNFQISLVSDLESLKWKALNLEYYNDQLPVYWGASLNLASSSYQIFADLDGDMLVDSDEINPSFGAKEHSSDGNIISNISLSDEVLILFPTDSFFPFFYDATNYSTSSSDLIIELKSIESNMAKLVIANQFGLNDAEDCSCGDSGKYCCSFCSVGSSCISY
jgi:hypothetical protein